MDKSHRANQQISIFNQLPARWQCGVEYSSLAQGRMIVYDKTQRPPQALEKGDLPFYPNGQKPASGFITVRRTAPDRVTRVLGIPDVLPYAGLPH